MIANSHLNPFLFVVFLVLRLAPDVEHLSSIFCCVVKKDVKDDHYAAVAAALSQLHALCENICSKSITLRSLNNIRDKEAELKKLCDTVSSGNPDMCMTFTQVKPHLDECFCLQSQFADYRNQISTLLEFCSDISYGTVYVYIFMVVMILNKLIYSVLTFEPLCGLMEECFY